MRRVLVSPISALLLFVLSTGCGSESVPRVLASGPPIPGVPPEAARPRTMQPFHSDSELAAYLKELAAKQRRAMRVSAQLAANYEAAPPAAPSAGMPNADAKDESVTNVQHAGVDEGSIVREGFFPFPTCEEVCTKRISKFWIDHDFSLHSLPWGEQQFTRS